MPYEFSPFTLPCGARATRVTMTGFFEGHEVLALKEHWKPGGPLHGLPTLVLTQQMDGMAPEARSIFSSWKENPPNEWFAIVVTNTLIRVSANFILRVSKTTRRRLFTTEETAVQWLDERARESGAK